jgi:hypothetical protein
MARKKRAGMVRRLWLNYNLWESVVAIVHVSYCNQEAM